MGLGLALILCQPATAAKPPVCAGGQSIGQFRFLVQPAPKVRALPLAAVNRLEKGRKLLYIPIRLKAGRHRQASIALVLIPAGRSPEKEWVVLDPRPAAAATQWEVPFDVEVVAAVYGPRGLNIKKIKSLVKNNQDVITQLARKTTPSQTSQVGALVEALATWERSPANSQPLDAVLQGFSSQHNISLPRIDPKAPATEHHLRHIHNLLCTTPGGRLPCCCAPCCRRWRPTTRSTRSRPTEYDNPPVWPRRWRRCSWGMAALGPAVIARATGPGGCAEALFFQVIEKEGFVRT